MSTEFEALFIEDEVTVRKALGITKKKKPNDWKAFPKHERDYSKSVLDHAIYAATKKRSAYSSSNMQRILRHETVMRASSDEQLAPRG